MIKKEILKKIKDLPGESDIYVNKEELIVTVPYKLVKNISLLNFTLIIDENE